MRVLALVLLAGCMTPVAFDDATIAGCTDYVSIRVVEPYAVTEAETSTVVFLIDGDGAWVADAQDESDHQHIVATGQGLYNLSQAQYDERLAPWVVTDGHAVLAWHAAIDAAAGQALCQAFFEQPDCADCPWQVVGDGDDWTESRSAAPTDALGQTLCVLWQDSKEDAMVLPQGGHHGNLCP